MSCTTSGTGEDSSSQCVICERVLELDNEGTRAIARVRKPIKLGEDVWECTIEVARDLAKDDQSTTEFLASPQPVKGIDSLQAIQVAFDSLRLALSETGASFRFLDFPAGYSGIYGTISGGPKLERHLEEIVEKENERIFNLIEDPKTRTEALERWLRSKTLPSSDTVESPTRAPNGCGMMEESPLTVSPRITRDGTDVELTSRIRFRMSPASRELAGRPLARGEAQVLFAHPQYGRRLVVWPLNEELAIVELTDRGPVAEYSQLEFAHRLGVELKVRALRLIAAFSEVIAFRGLRGDGTALTFRRTPSNGPASTFRLRVAV
jgi:uncharacterized protein YlaI